MFSGIKVQFAVSPAGGEARSVIERSIHLKIFVVMFDLRGKTDSSSAVAIVDLPALAVALNLSVLRRVGCEESRRQLMMREVPQKDVAARDPVPATGQFGIGKDPAKVI